MSGSDRAARAVLAVVSVVLAGTGVVAAVVVGGDDGERLDAGGSSLDRLRDWQVAVLNGDVEATDDAIRDRYSASFLAAVPPSSIRDGAATLGPLGPWRAGQEIERRGDEVLAVQLLGGGGEEARLTIFRGGGGRIEGSTILRATPCAAAVDPEAPIATPLADRLEDALGLFRERPDPSDEELAGLFAPSFLAELPPTRLRAALDQIRAIGPFRVRSFEGEPLQTSLVARLGVRTGEEARLTLGIEPDAPHRITTLTLLTQQPCRTSSPD